MKRPSAVVDTNLFISALIRPRSKPSQLIALWKRKRFALITSDLLLRELEEVLSRPKYLKKYDISPYQRKTLPVRIQQNAFVVQNLDKPSITIRDPKDLIVLATALDGNADYLITGDKDLLVLKDKKEIQPLKIVTLAEFLAVCSGKK